MNRSTTITPPPAAERGTAAAMKWMALGLVLATAGLCGGCSPARGERERYMASRALVVAPKAGDKSMTLSAWPAPLQPTLARATPMP
jgi:hypothetical protein